MLGLLILYLGGLILIDSFNAFHGTFNMQQNSRLSAFGDRIVSISPSSSIPLSSSSTPWSSISGFLSEADETTEGSSGAFFYLKDDLGLSEDVLQNIILKYSWILYLKVDTNLRPTIRVLRSYGFTLENICSMVAKVPSVLAMNCEITLPHKLEGIRQEFNLLQPKDLVQVVVDQPMLLTSSLSRNMGLASLFNDVMGFTDGEVRQIFLANPKVSTAGITVVETCWDFLLDDYGFEPPAARALILRNPWILSKRAMEENIERMDLFNELGFGPPSFGGAQKIILRCPSLLYINANYFLRQNTQILRKELQLDDDGLFKIVNLYPQLLCHNPNTLLFALRKAMHTLTGDECVLGLFDDDLGDIDNTFSTFSSVNDSDSDSDSDNEISFMRLKEQIIDIKNLPTVDVDVLSGIIPPKQTAAIAGSLQTRMLFDSSPEILDRYGQHITLHNTRTLCLDEKRARNLIAKAPFLLSYTSERTSAVLGVLASSLSLSRIELTKCVNTYPRLLSLSPERERGIKGKLTLVLQCLAKGAKAVMAAELAAGVDMSHSLNWRVIKSIDLSLIRAGFDKDDIGVSLVSLISASDSDLGGQLEEETIDDARALWEAEVLEGKRGRVAVFARRMHPIRRMVREAVIRYPLILGTALDRLEARMSDFLRLVHISMPVRGDGNDGHTAIGKSLRWDAFIQILRRSDSDHDRWLKDIEALIDNAIDAKDKKEKDKKDDVGGVGTGHTNTNTNSNSNKGKSEVGTRRAKGMKKRKGKEKKT